MPELTPELQTAMRTYQSAGQKDEGNSQVSEGLDALAARGVVMSNYAFREIVKAGERGYRLTKYIVQPENFDVAKKLHDLKDESEEENVAEVQRLLLRNDRHGYGLKYEPRRDDTEKYLYQRKQDIQSGLRRR